MYSLFSGLFERILPEPDEFKILIVGTEGSGKSTVLEAMKNELNHNGKGRVSQVQPTAGLNLSRCRDVFGSNLYCGI